MLLYFNNFVNTLFLFFNFCRDEICVGHAQPHFQADGERTGSYILSVEELTLSERDEIGDHTQIESVPPSML